MSDMSVFVAPGLPIDVSPGSPLHPFGFAESVLPVLILLLALILVLGIIIVWGTLILSGGLLVITARRLTLPLLLF